jgi:hypothetical protein
MTNHWQIAFEHYSNTFLFIRATVVRILFRLGRVNTSSLSISEYFSFHQTSMELIRYNEGYHIRGANQKHKGNVMV